MASLPGHAVAVCGLGAVLLPSRAPGRMWVWGVLLALFPDVDALGYFYGVPYGHPWGHRGLTHSVMMAVLLACAVMAWERRRDPGIGVDRTTLFLILAALSHGLLDAATNGGLGVGFWLPFESTRYFFPWRPIRVSPMGGAFFGTRGWRVLLSEALWIGLPSLALCLGRWGQRRVRDRVPAMY